MLSPYLRAALILLALLLLPVDFGWAAAGGPDAAGYFWADDLEPTGPSFDWEDLSLTGSVANGIGSCFDCVQSGVPIGFDFDFYGDVYDTVSIASAGIVGFGVQPFSGCCSGGPIPSASTPNNMIAMWWGDLSPVFGGTVYYETRGFTPYRRFIVSFQNVAHLFGGGAANVQVKLFEGNDFIEVHALNATTAGFTHSLGIENETGMVGVQYHSSSAPLPPDTAVQFFRCLYVDNDADGFDDCSECDDDDPDTYPGAPEVCDGADNDCDGEDPALELVDRDGDGYSFCDGDCDDFDAATFLGAPESCDAVDNDCDGGNTDLVDDDDGLGEQDIDGDGVLECGGDCDDLDPWIFPGYVDICDGLDNNCDGRVDEDLSTDADGDGHYTPGSCAAPADDCDDATRLRYPTNPEICDLVDNDCDALVDEGNLCGGLGCSLGQVFPASAVGIGGLLWLLFALLLRRPRDPLDPA